MAAMPACFCFSQTKYIDSLHKNILLAKSNDLKLKAIFLFCDEANSLNLDTLYKYSTVANTIAIRNKLNR